MVQTTTDDRRYAFSLPCVTNSCWNAPENQLKKLRAEQKKKLEEIKTKHNFDKTRELLEMYGEIPRKVILV